MNVVRKDFAISLESAMPMMHPNRFFGPMAEGGVSF